MILNINYKLKTIEITDDKGNVGIVHAVGFIVFVGRGIDSAGLAFATTTLVLALAAFLPAER